MNNDAYNLIYYLLEKHGIEERAKIASEINDGICSLLADNCPEGGCHTDIFDCRGEEPAARTDKPEKKRVPVLTPRVKEFLDFWDWLKNHNKDSEVLRAMFGAASDIYRKRKSEVSNEQNNQ